MTDAGYDAVVLAGGRSSRMAGTDKTTLDVGGRSLLDRVLSAVAGAGTVVVVGDERPASRAVVWARERPPGGGPAAAVAAGISHVSAPTVVLLAGDLPFVTSETVAMLVASVHDDGAVLADGTGHPQWLCSAWRTDVLASTSLHDGGSLRAVLGALRFAAVSSRDAGPPAWLDCDTPDDLRRARELA